MSTGFLVALGFLVHLILSGAAGAWARNRQWSIDQAIAMGIFWPVVVPVLVGLRLGTKRLKPVEQICPECKRRSEYR